jgi:hypothetical protein
MDTPVINLDISCLQHFLLSHPTLYSFSFFFGSRRTEPEVIRWLFSLPTVKEAMSAKNAKLRQCVVGFPASPCISNQPCTIPFVVPPSLKFNCTAFNFGSDVCNDGCACDEEPPCDYSFLLQDGDYEVCPDTHRTCTRSECCPTDQPRAGTPSPIPTPPPGAAPRSDYHFVEQSREKLPVPAKAPKQLESSKGKRPAYSQTQRRGEGEVKVLKVSLVSKDLHPQRHRISEGAKVWGIEGQGGVKHAGVRINLARNSICHFEIQQDIIPGEKPQSFYFSRDIMGPGKELGVQDAPCLEGTKPVINGILTLRIDDNTPTTFYYHSDGGPFRGGEVVIQGERS